MIEIEKTDFKELQRILPIFSKEVSLICKKNEDNIIEKKERFNVFDSLTKHHLEELHTNFISYMLDPKATHDCDSIFLNCFIQTLIESDKIKNIIEKSSISMDYSTVTVHKEFIEGSEKLDIYIHFPGKLNIVIENKIGAREQFKQIKRYVEFCEKRKKTEKEYIVLYLTPTGWHSKTAGGKEYYPISYNKHILKWLNKCMESDEIKDSRFVISGIKFYKDMIEKNISELSKKKSNLKRGKGNVAGISYP